MTSEVVGLEVKLLVIPFADPVPRRAGPVFPLDYLKTPLFSSYHPARHNPVDFCKKIPLSLDFLPPETVR